MQWTVQPAEIGDINRQKEQPNYGFIEQAIAGGSAYSIGSNGCAGYFIVGSTDSLAPGFVVELVLPELAVRDRYEALAGEMSERSLGVLWFDSSDRDACDFAWRLNLSVRSGPPLFAGQGLEEDVPLDGFDISIAEKSEHYAVIRLLSSVPPDAGGQTAEAARQNVEGRVVHALRRDGEIVGAAVLSPLPGPYVALSSVVMRTYSELPRESHEQAARDLELLFMNSLAAEVARKNLTLVYSMARQTPNGFLEAMQLNMTLTKQSFTARLTERPPEQDEEPATGIKGMAGVC